MFSRRRFMSLSVGMAGIFLLRKSAYAQVYCPILMYHHIAHLPEHADAVRTDLSVTPENFSRQLALLQEEGFASITMQTLWAHLSRGVSLPPKPIILSFDDGYDNAYFEAFPRLLSRGMVGTFFLVRDFMGQSGYLTWDMAREMKKAGMELGNHSTTHSDLFSMEDYHTQYEEIEGMAAAMGAGFGERPHFFCYPMGKYNRTTLQVLRDTGHVAAVTISDGTAKYRVDPFRMSRLRIRHTTTPSTLSWLVNRYI